MIPSDLRSATTDELASALARLASHDGRRRVAFNPYRTDWSLPIDPDTAERELYTLEPTEVIRRHLAEASETMAAAERLCPDPSRLTAAQVIADLDGPIARLRSILAHGNGSLQSADVEGAVARLHAAEARLERARRAQALHGPDYVVEVLEPPRSEWFSPPDVKSARRELARLRGRLRQAEARDALLADRPAGCWCFGTGGRGRAWVASNEEAAAAGTEWLYHEYCPCPDGQALQSQHTAARERLFAYRSAGQREERLLTAAVPRDYRGLRITTFPVIEPNPGRGLIGNRASFELACKWWAAFKAGTARKQSLVMWGEPGVGKSGLAAAFLDDWQAAQRAANQPAEAMFAIVPELLDRLRATYNQEGVSVEELVRKVIHAPFLVLDDLASEKMTDWGAEKLFQIINGRHNEDRPTIFTSNASVDALDRHFAGALSRNPSPEERELASMRGARIVRRVLKMAEVLEFVGDDLSADGLRERAGLDAVPPVVEEAF